MKRSRTYERISTSYEDIPPAVCSDHHSSVFGPAPGPSRSSRTRSKSVGGPEMTFDQISLPKKPLSRVSNNHRSVSTHNLDNVEFNRALRLTDQGDSLLSATRGQVPHHDLPEGVYDRYSTRKDQGHEEQSVGGGGGGSYVRLNSNWDRDQASGDKATFNKILMSV